MIPPISPALVRLAQAQAPLRDPREAVSFVEAFNDQLGLKGLARGKKEQLTARDAARFLRVNPALFFQDVKGPYAAAARLLSRPSPRLIIAGDAHLGNFGTIESEDGRTMWGLNDYDMAGWGSVENELERTATSIVLMASDPKPLIAQLVRGYAGEMRRLSGRISERSGLTAAEASGPVARLIAERSGKSAQHVLKKFTAGLKLMRNEELIEPTPADRLMVEAMFAHYDESQGPTPRIVRPVHLLDLARRVDSGGSTYALNRFYALVQGSAVPVILEIKQELPCAPETASGNLHAANAAQLAAHMRALGGMPNPLEATAAASDKTTYLIRQREPEKGSLELSKLGPADALSLVAQAGVALARAHAHQRGAAAAVSTWIGRDEVALVSSLVKFAELYAAQTRADVAAFSKAI